MTSAASLIPQAEMDALASRLAEDGGVDLIDAALETYPSDPRLHFLRGSVLAGNRDYANARTAMGRAVNLAPDYAIARFQLGFLEFTSGEASAAAQTWAALLDPPIDEPLRLFADGLMRLPADDVAGAVERLKQGIAVNAAYPPLNRDMTMLIEKLSTIGSDASEPEPTSETDLLLRQFGQSTRH